MSVGKRIRALRAKSGISNQEELAYLVGTARQTVSSWERAIFLPDGANLIKLSKVLNTSIAYIMGETLDPCTAERNGEKSLEGERMTTAFPVYTLKAGGTSALFLSVERSEGGKTVRYDLPPELSARMLPFIEELWERIEREMEGK